MRTMKFKKHLAQRPSQQVEAACRPSRLRRASLNHPSTHGRADRLFSLGRSVQNLASTSQMFPPRVYGAPAVCAEEEGRPAHQRLSEHREARSRWVPGSIRQGTRALVGNPPWCWHLPHLLQGAPISPGQTPSAACLRPGHNSAILQTCCWHLGSRAEDRLRLSPVPTENFS